MVHRNEEASEDRLGEEEENFHDNKNQGDGIIVCILCV